MFLVKLTASSFFDLISKQARPDGHCKGVLNVLFIYFIFFATQNVQRKKGKKYTQQQKWPGSLK